jgi:hypothetical protein
MLTNIAGKFAQIILNCLVIIHTKSSHSTHTISAFIISIYHSFASSFNLSSFLYLFHPTTSSLIFDSLFISIIPWFLYHLQWSMTTLTDDMTKYAALDVTKGLEVYFKLEELFDFSKRIKSQEAVSGETFDVVPQFGRLTADSHRTGRGKIVNDCSELTDRKWSCASPLDPTISLTVKLKSKELEKSVLVEMSVDSLRAPLAVVPFLKGKEKESLGFKAVFDLLGRSTITFVLPVGMLAPCIPQALQSPMPPPSPIATATNSPGDVDNDDEDADDEANAGAAQHNAIDDDATDDDMDRVGGSGRGGMPENTDRDLFLQEDEDDDFDDDDGNHRTDADNNDEGQDYEKVLKSLRAAVLAGVAVTSRELGTEVKYLGEAPKEALVDKYSSVLGDIWHLMDRVKVPMRHTSKKAYYVALTRAFFLWDKEGLEVAKDKLREENMSEADIETKMYFSLSWFLHRVRRHVPKVSILYWRVRAVYAIYGKQLDDDGVPLFNAACWKKAKLVLKAILAGEASDPPGVSFYSFKLRNGVPMTDARGLNLISCNRGTNSTENGEQIDIIFFIILIAAL